MMDDTTPRAQEIGRWLDAPMDFNEAYSKPIVPQPRSTMPKSNAAWTIPVLIVELVALAVFLAWFA